MSHRKLVGYRFHLLQIHIYFEDFMCTWDSLKAEEAQRGRDGRYIWHKLRRQVEWLQWNNNSIDEDSLHWTSAFYGPPLSWLVCLPPFYPFLQLLHSLSVIVFIHFILIPCSSNHCVFSDWNPELVLLLLSILMKLFQPCCRHIWCTVYVHSYNTFFLCKTFPHVLALK